MASVTETLTSVNLLTIILGPFVGSALAFLSARQLDAGRRHRERVAAANLALFALKQQYNDFLLYRKGFRTDVARYGLKGDEPLWALLRPTYITFSNQEVDLKSIGFLFERKGNGEVFDVVGYAQMLYRDLVRMSDLATASARSIQERAAEAQAKNPGISWADLELAAGKDITAHMAMSVCGLTSRLERNEQTHIRAFKMLRSALDAELNSGWVAKFRNVWSTNGGATLVDMKEPEPKFKLDALPPMPKRLAEAVATMRED
jgi:hypothetical protein